MIIGPLSPLATIPQSDTLYLCILFAIMFLTAVIGIANLNHFSLVKGLIGIKTNCIRMHLIKDILSFQKSTYKDYHVECILSQFFMSHNIAVGLSINSIVWVSIYLFAIKE